MRTGTALAADYKQIELRLMAHFSGDPALCALLRNPAQDPFTLLAAEWKRVAVDKVRGDTTRGGKKWDNEGSRLHDIGSREQQSAKRRPPAKTAPPTTLIAPSVAGHCGFC